MTPPFFWQLAPSSTDINVGEATAAFISCKDGYLFGCYKSYFGGDSLITLMAFKEAKSDRQSPSMIRDIYLYIFHHPCQMALIWCLNGQLLIDLYNLSMGADESESFLSMPYKLQSEPSHPMFILMFTTKKGILGGPRLL